VSPEYIPYGTTISMAVDEKVLEKHNLERDKYVLFVGRLVYEKGIHTLVEAFAKVKTDLKLVIIGGALTPGSYVENLKKMADKRVVFLGYVHGSEYESIRNAARVYVHPSLFDGTSISLLGAMGAGKSVLSSDLKENMDVGGDGVLFFEKENSDDLAAKLQLLLDDPKSGRTWGDRALSRAKSLPTWDDIASSYEAIYKRLLH
jgi:glycosyltransferase involved in cell wall biosynthesis